MAATDDPRYAYLRASWPPPDPQGADDQETIDNLNSQLPTSNSQGESFEREGGRSSNKPVDAPFAPLFE